MITWVFTFGHGQRLRSTGKPRPGSDDYASYTAGGIGLPLHNRYVRIPGENFADCRAKMVAIFGPVWSFDYRDEERAGVVEYGLVELDVTDALVELDRDGWPPNNASAEASFRRPAVTE